MTPSAYIILVMAIVLVVIIGRISEIMRICIISVSYKSKRIVGEPNISSSCLLALQLATEHG